MGQYFNPAAKVQPEWGDGLITPALLEALDARGIPLYVEAQGWELWFSWTCQELRAAIVNEERQLADVLRYMAGPTPWCMSRDMLMLGLDARRMQIEGALDRYRSALTRRLDAEAVGRLAAERRIAA